MLAAKMSKWIDFSLNKRQKNQKKIDLLDHNRQIPRVKKLLWKYGISRLSNYVVHIYWVNKYLCSSLLSFKSFKSLYWKNIEPSFNPIPNGLNPRVVSRSDFCAYLAWPHFFSRTPRNFLMVSKQLHIKALSKCSFNFQPNSSVAVRMMNSFFERS